MPSAIEIINSGTVPIFLMVGYSSYSDDTSIVATDYLHVLLPAGDSFSPPVRSVISDNADNTIMFGTAVDNLVPNSNMYADIDTVGNAAFDVTTDPVSFDVTDGDFWRVGDMMRCQAEVVQITAISSNTVTVNRGMLGTTTAAHGDGETLRLQFSNDYHDFDKYTVAQTDANGKFKCTNFFGQGRSATGNQGIIAGSFNIKFYNAGYRNLGLSGITSSTETGLTAGGSYWLKIAIDGGTPEAIN